MTVEVIRARGGADILRKLFEPLGYNVEATPIPLDEKFPEWGESRYFRLMLKAAVTVHDALSHLYVLLPVLDDEKHYYIGDARVDKLLRHGEGWLGKHPARELIVQRYLKRRPSLVDQAMARLLDEENADVAAVESKTEEGALAEKDLERPMTLHTHRLNLVATRLKALDAKTILDLGCGEGKLLRRLLADRAFEHITGMDVSHRALEVASLRLRLDRMPDRQRKRIQLMQGSLLYRDKRLSGFDAAALVEVIEHLDQPRLVRTGTRPVDVCPPQTRRHHHPKPRIQRVVSGTSSREDAARRSLIRMDAGGVRGVVGRNGYPFRLSRELRTRRSR